MGMGSTPSDQRKGQVHPVVTLSIFIRLNSRYISSSMPSKKAQQLCETSASARVKYLAASLDRGLGFFKDVEEAIL